MVDLYQMRNVGIVAHIDAGKTTLSERILLKSGVERRMGAVHEGTTVLDWMPEERRRGISIGAATTNVPWRGHEIHLIDTPGHVDFTVEVERSLRVLDGAVLVISALAGVQAQSEAVWRQARRHRVPGIAFVNQCDRQGSDFLRALADLRERLGMTAVAVSYPIAEGPDLVGIVDLVTRGAQRLEAGHTETAGAPEELADEIELLRQELVEVLAEHDESLVEFALGERDAPADVLAAALRRATLEGRVTPVLCGSALMDVGVDALLDAVVAYLPSPLDRGPVEGAQPGGGRARREPSLSAPLCALAFKFLRTRRAELVLVRLYSGWLRPGDELVNPRNGARERIEAVYRVHADSLEPLAAAKAGDIVGLLGCRATGTGDTLCAPGEEMALEGLVLPEPVMSLVAEPVAEAQREALAAALAQFAREDPTLHVREDAETGQWIVAGMGELHLDVLAHRMQDEFGVAARFGRPEVHLREAPLGPGQGSARLEREVDGGWVSAEAQVELGPDSGHEGVEVRLGSAVDLGEVLGAEIEAALRHGAENGPLRGAALGRAWVELSGVTLSGPNAQPLVPLAARLALQAALESTPMELREPVMSFEVDTPSDTLSQVMASLLGHRAEVGEVRTEGNQACVRGIVPLAGLFGYASLLRSASQGRASCSLSPAGSRPVPEGGGEGHGRPKG